MRSYALRISDTKRCTALSVCCKQGTRITAYSCKQSQCLVVVLHAHIVGERAAVRYLGLCHSQDVRCCLAIVGELLADIFVQQHSFAQGSFLFVVLHIQKLLTCAKLRNCGGFQLKQPQSLTYVNALYIAVFTVTVG